MPLLVWVFVLQLAIHLVNTIGASALNALLWNIYNRFPVPTSNIATEQRVLQKKFLKMRQELNATSSQDEFAKWAKLRRQHDKIMEDLEKMKSTLDTTKSTFDKVISVLRWLGTTGLRTLLQFWFTKEPMFWLPKGWVPYYAEWLLSFPRAPLGSVSIQAWGLACGSVILLVSDSIIAIVTLVAAGTQKTNVEKKKEKPVMAEKGAGRASTTGASTGAEKGDWEKRAAKAFAEPEKEL